MRKKQRVICAIVSVLVLLTSASSAFAAGYEVIVEPKFYMYDGPIPGEYDISGKFFYPTPFYMDASVVHREARVMAGRWLTYYDAYSYVVDCYGNKKELGDYSSFGALVYSDFSENPSEYEYYEGCNSPAFEHDFSNISQSGYIVVTKNGKGGMIDLQGNVIIPCEYDNFYEDYSGEIVFDFPDVEMKRYEGKYYFPYYDPYYYMEEVGAQLINGLAVVANGPEETAKVGIVDQNDNIIVPFIYDMITPCFDTYCWALKDNYWSIISVSKEPITIKVNGEKVFFDQTPLIINGRTLAPLRAIFEKLGADVQWDGATRTITSTRGDTVVTMTVDQKDMFINGEKVTLDVAPQIIGDRTLVPVRAIAEAFDCQVDWDGVNQTVSIIH